jgi:diguanylate cyclase
MKNKLRCKVLEKIEDGEKLTKEDEERIKEILKRELEFIVKRGILPTPKNFERWFLIFCYVLELNIEPTDDELLDLYFKSFSEDADQSAQMLTLHNIFSEVIGSLKTTVSNIKDFDRSIAKEGEKLGEYQAIQVNLEGILEALNNLREQNRALVEKLEKQTQELKALKRILGEKEKESSYDLLTGLRNRRSFERSLRELFKYAKENHLPLSLIIMDIDNFKEINDTYGHLEGDKVLIKVGTILRNYLRARDIVARWGGEEFTILLPGTDKKDAIHVAEKLRLILENQTFTTDKEETYKITASFGVAQVDDSIETPEELFKRADENLYRAKRAGKNRVMA